MHNILKNKPVIMGVVNVTPDSFSDGGEFYNKNNAIDHGRKMLSQGAHILDVGGESTRPGAETVGLQEELDRVIPVIEELSNYTDQISIDTRNALTMEESLKAGATYINDISGLTHDDKAVEVAKAYDVPIFVMHAQGAPQTMQNNPNYNNVIEDVLNWFELRISVLETHGIEKNRLILDPGIGFGKKLEHNLLILSKIKEFHDLGCPLLIGTSRKSFIEKIDEGADTWNRIGGSLASILHCLDEGVQFFRVHDVAETAQAFKVYEAIKNAAKP